MITPPRVVVVGSANIDLLVSVPALVAPGHTVLAGSLTRAPGGKGANQAVAARRLGQPTALIGCVGRDADGRWLREQLRRDDVALDHLAELPDRPTGLALIQVDDTGENGIVVAAGANAALSPEHIVAAGELLAGAAVVLAQLEVPAPAVLAAARRATGRVFLNPAPAAALDRALLSVVDVLIPNRSELAALAATPEPRTLEEVRAVLAAMPFDGDAVVTLGADGALVRQGRSLVHVPAVAVRVRDTTGAGDAFCGALADATVRGADLVEAARWAARVAAHATAGPGAQPSYPTAEDLCAA